MLYCEIAQTLGFLRNLNMENNKSIAFNARGILRKVDMEKYNSSVNKYVAPELYTTASSISRKLTSLKKFDIENQLKTTTKLTPNSKTIVTAKVNLLF